MNLDDIIMQRRNKVIKKYIREIKSVLADCTLSELDKLDEIEYIIKSYREKTDMKLGCNV